MPADVTPMRDRLIGAAASSFALRLAGLAVGLSVGIALARLLGPAGYGTYAFVFACASLVSVPVQFGLPDLLVRESARSGAGALLLRADRIVVAMSVMIALCGLVLALTFGTRDLPPLALLFGFLLIPLGALANLRGAILRGLGRVVLGQMPEMILRPVAFLLLIGLALLVAPGLTPTSALGLHAAAAAVALFATIRIFRRRVPAPIESAEPTPIGPFLKSAAILGTTAGLQVINSSLDLVMLGFLRSDAETGFYRVASSAAVVTTFGLLAVNAVIMSRISRHVADGDMAGLQRLTASSAGLGVLTALPPGLAFIAFGAPILTLVFGGEFAAGASALAILAAAQIANCVFGPVGQLLNMSGHERDTLTGVAMAAILNIVLNLALIPPFGVEGAAVATALTVLAWNVLLWRRVRTRLGIDSTALSLVRR